MDQQGTNRTSILLLASLAVYGALAFLSLSRNNQNDLAVYRAGAAAALKGHSPYDTALVRREVARVLPPADENGLALSCGFFLPPQAIPVFAPFALMTWQAAETSWSLLLTAFGLGCGTLAWTFGRAPARQGSGWAMIVVLVLLNPVSQLALVVGQTSMLVAGSIAFGQYCFERGRAACGCLLWGLAFIKPHLAIPFLVLAWALGGWRRLVGIVCFVGILNLVGGLLVRGAFDGAMELFLEYVQYVASNHKLVTFNLVDVNFQILSWNRIVAASGGQAIDLKIWMILAGFALWGLLVLARLSLKFGKQNAECGMKSGSDCSAYLLAVTATGALFFAQVLAYELVLLVLLVPLILQNFDKSQRIDAWFLIGILCYLMIPIDVTEWTAELLQLDESSRGRTLLRSHKCFGMGLLALYLLVRGIPPSSSRIPANPQESCSPLRS